MKTITFRLSAPLQSYGNEASFDRRTTGDYPSKSAVIGMLAAALGYHRDDTRISSLNNLMFAVRIDQPGTIMTEFQTVEWKKAKRKITYREFVQDAAYVVAIGAEDNQLADEISWALKHPVFQIFLGRRANMPAGPLRLDQFVGKTPVEVLTDLSWQASTWFKKRQKRSNGFRARIIGDANLLPERATTLVKDAVVSFNPRGREFAYRAVATTTVVLANEYGEQVTVETEHDIMSTLEEGERHVSIESDD